MLPVPTPEGGFPPFRGVKSKFDLIFDISELPRVLQKACRCFCGGIDDVLAWNLRYDELRVPLDTRRYGVKRAPWTCDVLPVDISSCPGLLAAYSNLKEWRARTENMPTNMCHMAYDEDLHFGVLQTTL